MCEIAGYTFLGVSTVGEFLAIMLMVMGFYVLAIVVKLAYRAWR